LNFHIIWSKYKYGNRKCRRRKALYNFRDIFSNIIYFL